MDMQTLALAFLTMVTVGGLAWVFIYPLLSGEKQAEKRRAAFSIIQEPVQLPDPSQRSSAASFSMSAMATSIDSSGSISAQIPMVIR